MQSSCGILAIGTDRADVGDLIVYLDVRATRYKDAVDVLLREHLRPTAGVAVRFIARPERDLLMPWQADEVVSATGQRFAIAEARRPTWQPHELGRRARTYSRKESRAKRAQVAAYNRSRERWSSDRA